MGTPQNYKSQQFAVGQVQYTMDSLCLRFFQQMHKKKLSSVLSLNKQLFMFHQQKSAIKKSIKILKQTFQIILS